MPYVSGAPERRRRPAFAPGIIPAPAVTTSVATVDSSSSAASSAASASANPPIQVVYVRRRDPRGTAGMGTPGTALALPDKSQRIAVVPADAAPSTALTRRNIILPARVRRRATTTLTPAEQDDQLGSWLSSALHGIGHAATQVGHVVGKVVTSKVGQGILGGALALTGVGVPAAAGIFAATKGVGNLIKPGGNLKNAATGAAQGAVEGVVASAAGSGVRKLFGSKTPTPATTTAAGRPSVAGPVLATTQSVGTAAINTLPTSGAAAAALPITMTPSAPAIPTIQGPSATPLLTLPGTLPAVPQTAPAAGTARRVASQSGAIPGYAGQVMQAGRAASGGASRAAADAKMAAAALQSAAAIAANSGQAGLATDIANIAGTVGGVAGGLQTASGAIQGAATGAVAGAQTSVIQQWIAAHKTLVYGGAAGVGLLTLVAILKPRRAVFA